MSSVCNSPEMMSGPLYVTSEESTPKCNQDDKGQPVTGSAYIQGPFNVGEEFSSVKATVMLGELNNNQTETPDRTLHVTGDTIIEGDGKTENALYITGPTTDVVYIDGDLYVSGKVDCDNKGRLASRFATADEKGKTFDMVHPTKGKGWRLSYACIEGPEIGVYFRGRLTNKTEIEFPYYWKDLVHEDSISVQLQPIGAHQDVIVKRWDEEKVYLQSKGGMPIDCFYHIYAERKDINPLHVEYEGNSWSDYPDPNHINPNIEDEKRNLLDPKYRGPRNTITKKQVRPLDT